MIERSGVHFYCPKTGDLCDRPVECRAINEPLVRVVPHIRSSVETGVAWRLAENTLKHNLQVQADLNGTDFHASFIEGTARICPDEYLTEFGNRYDDDYARNTIRGIVSRCIANTITDLE